MNVLPPKDTVSHSQRLKSKKRPLKAFISPFNGLWYVYPFERDSNNSRLYKNVDISLLKRVISLKVRPDFSLKKAVRQALLENHIADVSEGDTRLKSDTNNDTQAIQDDKLKQYESIINQLVESNLKLSEKLEAAIEKLENHDQKLLEIEQVKTKKKGFFDRLFKKTI